jgi:hypothetical protein
MLSLPHAWSLRPSHFTVCALVATRAVSVAAAEADETVATPPAVAPTTSAADAESTANSRVILLIRTRGDDETITRLRFELQEGGFRILEVRADARSKAEPLALTAERERVDGAIRVDAPLGRVELWMRQSGEAFEETFTSDSGATSGLVLAVRVAEALRARGLLLPPVSEPPVVEPARAEPPSPNIRAEPRPSPAERAPSPDAPTRFWLELGPGLVMSPGGIGPLAVIELGLRLEFVQRFSICLDGTIPFSRQTVEASEGEASVASSIAGGLVELEWARFSAGGLRSGLGAGASVTTMSGRAASGFVGADDTVVAFTPLARTSFHVNVGDRLRLRAGVLAGFTFPEVRVAFGEREVARFGRPFALASLSLEANPL